MGITSIPPWENGGSRPALAVPRAVGHTLDTLRRETMNTTTRKIPVRTARERPQQAPEPTPTPAASTLAAPDRLSTGLALLRVVIGIIFLMHGAQKLFVFGLPGVIGAFAGMGVPLPAITGPAVALLEFFGGLALIAGLFTPWVAGLLALDMLGAMLIVHLPAGFFAPEGIEFVLALFAAAVALVLIGPGRYSLDAVLGRRRAEV